MQRSERAEPLEFMEQRGINGDGLAVSRPTMDNTVPNRHRQASANLLAQKGDKLVERRGHGGNFRRRPCLIDQDFPRRALGKQSGLDTDTFDLTFEAPLKLVSNSNSEQLKLDARAARIHDENGFGHRSGPDRLFRAPAVSEQHGDSARSHSCAYVIGARR